MAEGQSLFILLLPHRAHRSRPYPLPSSGASPYRQAFLRTGESEALSGYHFEYDNFLVKVALETRSFDFHILFLCLFSFSSVDPVSVEENPGLLGTDEAQLHNILLRLLRERFLVRGVSEGCDFDVADRPILLLLDGDCLLCEGGQNKPFYQPTLVCSKCIQRSNRTHLLLFSMPRLSPNRTTSLRYSSVQRIPRVPSELFLESPLNGIIFTLEHIFSQEKKGPNFLCKNQVYPFLKLSHFDLYRFFNFSCFLVFSLFNKFRSHSFFIR